MQKLSVPILHMVFLCMFLPSGVVLSWHSDTVYQEPPQAGSILPGFVEQFLVESKLLQEGPAIPPAGYPAPERAPSPLGALLRSFAVPGWGHYYANPDGWRRGQVHLGAEVVLVASYLGIRQHAYVLEKNMYTHAAAYSGADIRAVDRQFELAVGNHLSLTEYNDHQERTRNLDRLLPDDPLYRWEWESDALRREYLELRNRRDNLDQQLPGLAALMVANRLISGISAFGRARGINGAQTSLHLAPGPEGQGFRTVWFVPF